MRENNISFNAMKQRTGGMKQRGRMRQWQNHKDKILLSLRMLMKFEAWAEVIDLQETKERSQELLK